MAVDIVTYNGEEEIWDIRYNILSPFVDEFIVCETPITFSGKEKPLYFEKIMDKYPKVKYYVIDENDPELWKMAQQSPNTVGADHWKREFVHKESIKKALTHLNDEDMVFIGDVDEIWNPILTHTYPKKTHKLGLIVYSYYINNRSSEVFYGTIITKWGLIKDKCLNHVRTNQSYFEYIPNGGWHFTSLKDGLKRKLEDSYTQETYASDLIMANLSDNIKNVKDFLGRPFTYQKDESDWPAYLKENKEKYKHLCL